MPHCKTFDPITLPRNRMCAIFSGKWNSPREFIWYVDGFCIHFCRSPGGKRGKSSCILRYQESHSSTFIHMVLISPGKSPRVFCITKKAIHQIFIEQEIHMSPCKTGFIQVTYSTEATRRLRGHNWVHFAHRLIGYSVLLP